LEELLSLMLSKKHFLEQKGIMSGSTPFPHILHLSGTLCLLGRYFT